MTGRGAIAVGLAALVLGLASADGGDPAALWRDFYHDRNTHYLTGLDMALALADGDPLGALARATADPVWPPLHAVVLALVLLVGGVGHGVAMLPSLAGWAATVGLGFALAARLAPAQGGLPWFVGAVAALLVLASPAFALLGADVMLEGLGAALGAAVLLAFIARPTGGGRGVALLLSLLFFEKYNYWLLVVASLLVTLVLDDGAGWLARVRAARPGMWVRRLVLSVPGLAGSGLLAASVALAVHGPMPVTLAGRGFMLFPALLLTLGYGLLLLQACRLWRVARGMADPELVVLVRWHILPVALWLLVPQALGRFLWFLGPTHGGASLGYDPWRALAFQWQGFAEGFHVPMAVLGVPLLPMAVLGFALLGGTLLMRRRRLRCVAVFAALSALVLVLHPQQQWRFQATMLFAVWVCAALGASWVLAWARRRWAAPAWLAGAAMLGVVAVATVLPPSAMALRVAIRSPQGASDIALAASWQPALAGARAVGVVTTFGPSDLFGWSLREACRCRVAVDQAWLRPAGDADAAVLLLETWLGQLAADHVLFVDAPPPYPVPGQVRLGGEIAAVLQGSPRLVPAMATPVAVGAAQVMVWRVVAPPPHPLPPRRRLDAALSAGLALAALSVLLWPARAPGQG